MNAPTPVDEITAGILQRPDHTILLLKRSENHTTNPGKWCFVTGYIEAGEDPESAARRETEEELGLKIGPASRTGDIVVVHTDWGRTLHIHPHLFHIAQEVDIRLDWEHSRYEWIRPEDLKNYDYVQQLDEDLIALGLL